MALLDLLRHRLRAVLWALTYKPMTGAEDPLADPDPAPADPDPADPDPDPDPADPADPEKVTPDDDWKAKARKHERAAKREREKREQLEKQLKDREDETKSEHEKALEKAREEAREEATREADKDRRSDRLEASVIKLAAQGFQVGEGEDAETVQFADADDALVNIQRGISRGDLDEDEIYDSEGKVNSDALRSALGELIKSKPHLRAGEKSPARRADPDRGKGSADDKSLEDMSVEDHAKRQGRTK